MDALRELWLLIRLKQTMLSVAYYQRDIERSREGLNRAILAYEQAKGDLDSYDMEPTPEVPTFLLKKEGEEGNGERSGAVVMGTNECGHGGSVALPTT